MIQVISLIGSMVILVAFAAGQFNRLEQTSVVYIVMNLVGSAILTVVAIIERQWGFLLLEGVWAIISLWSLAKVLRGEGSGVSH
jgi:hypothetical protein